MIGRVDLLDTRHAIDHWKAKRPRFLRRSLQPADARRASAAAASRAGSRPRRGARLQADRPRPRSASRTGTPVEIKLPIRNIHRTVGAMLSRRDRPQATAPPACPTTPSASSSPAPPARASARSSPTASRSNSKATPTITSAKDSPAARIIVYPPEDLHLRARREHPDRQRGPLRRHQRRSLLQRHGRRALRRAQLRRHRGRRRPGRSRLRVHDQRPGHRARQNRPQLRRRHARRHRLRARRDRRASQTYRCNKTSRRSRSRSSIPRISRLLHDWIYRHCEVHRQSARASGFSKTGTTMLPKFVKVFPHEYKRVLKKRRAHRDVSRRCASAARSRARSSWQVHAWVRSPAFWNTQREMPAPPSRRRARQRLVRDLQPFPEEKIRDAGRPLHGLRRALLPHRLPASPTSFPTGTIWSISGRWQEAIRVLHATNNFPEFTGRICPAPVRSRLRARHQRAAGHHQEHREDHRRSRLGRRLDRSRTARRHAPASASRSSAPVPPVWPPPSNCAAPATGSPSSKRPTASAACCATASPTSRWRSTSSTAASSRWRPKAWSSCVNAHVGENVAVDDLQRDFDAILLAGGAEQPRDLNVPGRELKGIHFAMDFLPQPEQGLRRRCSPRPDPRHRQARRHHRRRRHRRRLPGHLATATRPLSVHQFELLPKPPDDRAPTTPWPLWPMQLRVESSHEEGGMRDWSVATTRLHRRRARQREKAARRPRRRRRPSSNRSPAPNSPWTSIWSCSPWASPARSRNGLIEQLGVDLDPRGNVKPPTRTTCPP